MSAAQDPGGSSTLTALYRDAIREHASQPNGFQRPIEATHRHEEYNALCGDRVEIRLRVEGDTVAAAAFDGEGCAICMASASMLCGRAPGDTVDNLRGLAAALAKTLLQGTPPLPEDLRPLLGVRPYPSRVRCATLPWEAAVDALAGEAGGSKQNSGRGRRNPRAPLQNP